MRSRAHFKAHPIHPALVPFPFAFLGGAALFDLGYLISGHDPISSTAAHLTVAGVAAGVLAAVPGVIDYIYTVPPRSSARTVHCLWHGSQFDVCTGKVTAGPATARIEVFELKQRGTNVTLIAPPT